MIQGQDYLVFIKDGQDRFLYTDQYGEVRTSAQPKPVKITPDGWQEISLLNERNKKYWGLDRSFTIPLKWVEDGAKIIKTLYYTSGAQTPCTVIILEQYLWLTNSEYDYRYRLLYKGEPDLTTFSHEGAVVTVNCIEGGLAKLFKAYENTTYEIPCDEVTINHDGLNLESNSTYIQIEQLINSFAGFSCWTWWPSVTFVSNEGTVFDTEQQSVNFIPNGRRRGSNTPLDDNYFTDQYFFKANSAVTVNYRRRLRVTVRDFTRFRCYIKRSGGLRSMLVDISGNNSPSGQEVNIDIQVNDIIDMVAGETLSLICEIQDSPFRSGESTALIYEDQFYISYKSRYRATKVKAITLYTLFAGLVQKITSGLYGVSSSILTGSKVVVTCGDALRGIADAKIKTSISQFYEAVTLIPSIGPIGMGIVGDKLVIEPLAYWLTGTVIDLGEVNAFKSSCASEYLYNQINVGYAVDEDGDLNGKDKFHSTLQFTTSSLRAPKPLDLISPWGADPIEIEGNRINLQGKTTTDDSSDNKIYLLATDGAGNLDRTLNSGAIGIIDAAGIYNIGLSPKRILYAWGAFIHSFLRGQDSDWIVYQTSAKNPKLVAGGIAETDNVLVASLASPLFVPDFHDFECPVPVDYAALVATNPIRRFSYTYDGVTMTGIAFHSGIQPGLAGVQSFQCLSDVSNDLVIQIGIDG